MVFVILPAFCRELKLMELPMDGDLGGAIRFGNVCPSMCLRANFTCVSAGFAL